MKLIIAACSAITLSIAIPLCMGATPSDAYGKLAILKYDANKSAYEPLCNSLDLGDNITSQFLLAKINAPQAWKNGEIPTSFIMKWLLSTQKAKAFEWIVDHYTQFTADGRKTILVGLIDFKYRESYLLLSHLLLDKEPTKEIRNEREPSPFSTGPMRVCDLAYNTLSLMVRYDDISNCNPIANANYPMPAAPVNFNSSTPVEERDAATKDLIAWWDQNFSKVLKDKPSLSSTTPDIQAKLDSLLKRGRH